MHRRYRRRRPTYAQRWRRLSPAGKIAVVVTAAVCAAAAAIISANSKPLPPAPAYPVAPLTPVPLTTGDGGTLPALPDGGGGHVPLPHVYLCAGRHVRVCT